MENGACDEVQKRKYATLSNLQNYKFEIMLLGNSSVGKTALLNRLIDDKAPIRHPPAATAGAEFRIKTIRLEKAVITLKIWDSSGQERYELNFI